VALQKVRTLGEDQAVVVLMKNLGDPQKEERARRGVVRGSGRKNVRRKGFP